MELEFKKERDQDFLSSYDLVIEECGKFAPFLQKEFLLHQAILRPAKRFYVSEEQAFDIINSMMKGKYIVKNSLKRLMYEEILLRVKKELEFSEDSMQDIIMRVINQPAPRFYMTIQSAQILYYKLIKMRRK